MNLLEIATLDHKEWIAMARQMGCKDFSEDVVQEMYIRLNRYVHTPQRIMQGQKINKAYIYMMLKNLSFDLAKAQSKSSEVITLVDDLSNFDQRDEVRNKELDAFDKVLQKEFEQWHAHDQQVFLCIYKHGISQRELARETGICITSIHNTIKNARQRIKEAYAKAN